MHFLKCKKYINNIIIVIVKPLSGNQFWSTFLTLRIRTNLLINNNKWINLEFTELPEKHQFKAIFHSKMSILAFMSYQICMPLEFLAQSHFDVHNHLLLFSTIESKSYIFGKT